MQAAVRSKREFLRSVSLFERLPAHAIDRLVLAFESHVLRDGDFVFRQGDEGDRLYLVESGRVSLIRSDEAGRRRKLGTIDSGGYFGELALLSDRPRAATAQCVGEVELFSISGRELKRLLAESAPALRSIVGNIGEYRPPDKPLSLWDKVRLQLPDARQKSKRPNLGT
jgi:cAMP-dependent protein kinase regulator